MKKNTVSYLLILIGSIIAIYANAEKQQNIIILVGGLVVLMFGIYRLSSTITSNSKNEDPVNYNEEEE